MKISNIKTFARAVALVAPLMLAQTIIVPTAANAGVISSIKSAAKSVGSAGKSVGKGIGTVAKATAKGTVYVGKQAGLGVGSGVKRAAVAVAKSAPVKAVVREVKTTVGRLKPR